MKNITHLLTRMTGLALLSLLSVSVHADSIINNFDGGNSTAVPDAFTGTAGDGWTSGWNATGASSGNVPNLSGEVINTNPLLSGGNYLSFTGFRDADDTTVGDAWHQSYQRSFDGSTVQTAAGDPVRISANFRLDQAPVYDFHVQGGTEPNFGGGSTPWGAALDTQTQDILFVNVPEGTFDTIVLTADGTEGWDVTDLSRVYSLTVDLLNPGSDLTYHLALTDNVGNSWDSRVDHTGPLTGRGGNWQSLTTGARLAGTDSYVASIDSIAIIPEPSTLALSLIMLGVFAAGVARRKNR